MTTPHVHDTHALIGTRVGSCVLERSLGVGGMGAVYLARQARPHRQVALKLVRPQPSTDSGAWAVFLARFRREADAAAALDHANIVPIYEFGEEDDLAYLVMPYLADGSLAAMLAREGALPPRLAIAYVEQAAAALDCAHRHGIIHRDVKPSNLLLHPDGRLLLADFGIARPLHRDDLAATGGPAGAARATAADPADADATLTLAGVAMGTPEYMAPEQIRGDPISPATDIYALGTVAYALLAGHTPFGGGDTDQILARQLTEPPSPLREVAPGVAPQVAHAVMWALAKDPAVRPASALAFARALRGGQMTVTRVLTRTRPALAARDNDGERTPPRGLALAGGGWESGGAHVVEPAAALGLPVATDEPTLYDGSPYGGRGVPVWPGAESRAAAGGAGRRRTSLLALLAIAAATLLLVMLLGTALGSWLTQGGPSGNPSTGALLGQHAPRATATATITPLPTATATPEPTATPTPPADWLSATPQSITLGCHGDQSSAHITLNNLGPRAVSWMAQTPMLGGLQLTPNSGRIPPDGQQTITVTNTSRLFDRHGTITFTPLNADAGQPAAVNYTTNSC